jgi:two-component system CheB/CheR fusion protein
MKKGKHQSKRAESTLPSKPTGADSPASTASSEKKKALEMVATPGQSESKSNSNKNHNKGVTGQEAEKAGTAQPAGKSKGSPSQADAKGPPTPGAAPAQADSSASPSGARPNQFPVVGIGASAGGLAAFEAFFGHMPFDSKTGIAFVVVQHLDPDHKSILTELVRRCTRMRVYEVTDGMVMEPNCTYIIPPNRDLSLFDGKLHLVEPGARRGLRLPIDFFFRSLAVDRGDQSIGVILSGTGTDGTLGLRAIKETGGMSIVQEPRSAEYDGMPRSAITSGLADYILAPEQMPSRLLEYVKRTSKFRPGPGTASVDDASAWVLKIMAQLRSRTGHDFSNYKQNTIRRRVERRVAVNQIETLENYVRLLRQNPGELDTLFRELLIGVTGFFRDPGAFDALGDLALLAILTDRPPNVPVRVWVPGCSTGEEAYTIAMLLQEASDKLGRQSTVQIFATDIDQDSVEKARYGVYPANIAADVSPERLARFFTHEDKDFYRIKKTLRDQVVFALQDVIKDPPFSKLDLISCRNMLIYMEPVLQKRLLPLFHYALATGGFLLLGNSESVGEFTNLFLTVERKWKLYRRKEISFNAIASFAMPRSLVGEGERAGAGVESKERKTNLREVTERLLLRNYTPASVAVNERGEILYVHGRSGKYLELPSGDATLDLLRAAREGLKVELANALRRIFADRQPIYYAGLEVRTNGGFETVNVTVELADGPTGAANVAVVTFQEAPHPSEKELPASAKASPERRPESSTPLDEKDRHILSLERELRVKSETLQTTIEELETSNEEIKSANEELQSTNEELQSTNEELETSKEELQSVNEELVTVNTELQQKMDGLARANNDMNNLLAGTGIGMLFVDHQLHIQRFTPAMTQIIKLIQSDVGRPVSDLVSNLAHYDRLGQDVRGVLDSLIPREAEVQTRENHWYLMRILPYRTVENVIEGAVLTFVDIRAQKRAEEELRKLSTQLEQRVQARVAELERVNENLQKEIRHRHDGEARRAVEIAALARSYDVTANISQGDTKQRILQACLAAVIELTAAHMGTLQLYDEASKSFRLAASKGFNARFQEHFANVPIQGDSFCAEVLRRKERVIIDDLARSSIIKPGESLNLLQAAAVRVLQATPILTRDGRVLGALTTHWTESHHLDDGTLKLLDLLTRQLADRIDGSAVKA